MESIPINFKDTFNIEFKKLLVGKHIIKFTNCPDEYFISAIVVTDENDYSIKLALNSKIFKKAIYRNKY